MSNKLSNKNEFSLWNGADKQCNPDSDRTNSKLTRAKSVKLVWNIKMPIEFTPLSLNLQSTHTMDSKSEKWQNALNGMGHQC